MDVSKLEGEELDAAVAQAVDWKLPAGTWADIDWPLLQRDVYIVIADNVQGGMYGPADDGTHVFQPSKVWAHGGPIIERERISLYPNSRGLKGVFAAWMPDLAETKVFEGSTPLIAAMRAFVASKEKA